MEPTPISPFTPGYGKSPLVYGGHQEPIADLVRVFETMDFGENHSVLLSGLRGAGKTSMLNLLQDRAVEQNWLVISEDASTGLMNRVMESSIPRLIGGLDQPHRRRLTGVGVWKFSASWEYEGRPREIKPQLKTDLEYLYRAVEPRGILITIDEVASGTRRMRELAQFALQVSQAMSAGAQIMIVFAGVKVDLDALLREDHATFLRRSREIDFQRLSVTETRRVFEETIKLAGGSAPPAAIEVMVRVSQGYPYLIQLVGDYAWRHSNDGRLSLSDVEYSTEKALRQVERRVIRKAFEDLSPADQEFLKAMAQDEGPSRIQDIVERLGQSDQYVQVYRKRLIESGYVRPSGRGKVEFSLPYLDRFVRAQLTEGSDADSFDTGGWDALPPPEVSPGGGKKPR